MINMSICTICDPSKVFASECAFIGHLNAVHRGINADQLAALTKANYDEWTVLVHCQVTGRIKTDESEAAKEKREQRKKKKEEKEKEKEKKEREKKEREKNAWKPIRRQLVTNSNVANRRYSANGQRLYAVGPQRV